ncbi:transmembrane protein [Citrus sinensis]|uniref:Transmembrane protein n=1 Tax=Citrus sinensis TaxID=2711 RepID=A0ACB8JBP7_CITSI|nr:transmembrane protein [Citrus sinensis]
MGSSKKWAAFISSIASSLSFCFIVFQIPLFRIPCRSGKCTTPIEVTCFQLIISEVFPEFVAKVLLYPGASASAIMKGKSIPSYRALIGARRMSLIGTLLLLWGLVREAMMFKFSCDKASGKAVSIYPTMAIFVLCAFLSIRKDLRKIIRCCKAKHIKNWYDEVSYFVPFLEVCVAMELKEANPQPFQAGIL